MNKLEEYKEKQFDLQYKANFYRREGFDTAIALELPVKFAEYLDNLTDEQDEAIVLHYGRMRLTTKEHYLYWVDNIYKPE